MRSFLDQVTRCFSTFICVLAVGLSIWPSLPAGAEANTPPPPPSPSSPLKAAKPLWAKPQTVPPSSAAQQKAVQAFEPLSSASSWARLTNRPPFNPGAMILLTDGSLMVHDQGATNFGSRDWWRLTPDLKGNYRTGKWSKLASLPEGYAPEYFESAILPDGKVIIAGARYNNGAEATNAPAALYDPLADSWTSLPSPPEAIGPLVTGESTVLADGTFMLGGEASDLDAIFHPDPVEPFWTVTGFCCKADNNDEENWTLLPSGAVLTIDANNPNLTNSEIYSPATATWSSAGSTIVNLVDIDAKGGGTHETGPQLLRPDGTVFAAGATGHTAVYNSLKGSWTAGPDFPFIGGVQYNVNDGPAALLPSGKVLLMAGAGYYKSPTHFFLFDGTNLKRIVDPPNAAKYISYYGFMIVLPTGQVMFNSRLGDIELYTESGSAAPRTYAPVLDPLPHTTLVAGESYGFSGTRLNGVSEGAAYAEGYHPATNYPLVRIVIAKTRHVFYARTHDFSSRSVAFDAVSSANFTVPAGIETGAATLYVVANGIASAGVSVTVAKASGTSAPR